MTNPIKRLAYKIVFNDLRQINLFCGHYDAVHGNKDFVLGIMTVMEHIAYSIDDWCGESFSNIFTSNMVESEVKGESYDQ